MGTEPSAAVGYGGLGAKPPAARQFLETFWKKKAFLNAIRSRFARVQSHLKELDF